MTLEEICEEVIKLDKIDELQTVSDVAWERKKQIRNLKSALVKSMSKVGDMVEFVFHKTGEVAQGMLTKKLRSRGEVAVDGKLYRVPFSMLTKVD
jgi:hypothetical protein